MTLFTIIRVKIFYTFRRLYQNSNQFYDSNAKGCPYKHSRVVYFQNYHHSQKRNNETPMIILKIAVAKRNIEFAALKHKFMPIPVTDVKKTIAFNLYSNLLLFIIVYQHCLKIIMPLFSEHLEYKLRTYMIIAPNTPITTKPPIYIKSK